MIRETNATSKTPRYFRHSHSKSLCKMGGTSRTPKSITFWRVGTARAYMWIGRMSGNKSPCTCSAKLALPPHLDLWQFADSQSRSQQRLLFTCRFPVAKEFWSRLQVHTATTYCKDTPPLAVVPVVFPRLVYVATILQFFHIVDSSRNRCFETLSGYT